ncbi:MAG: carbon starvation protein A, partial [Bacteroidaceae bacterium]|nr:carbon starvation protein A [Bacteroidaceae bacterium]
KSKPTVISLLPAIFMTYICASYIFVSPMMCGMSNRTLAYICGGILTLVIMGMVMIKTKK